MAATAYLVAPSIPSDYHRIVSPTLSIPTSPQVSVPVGILACQRNPLLRSLETTVVSVSVGQPPAEPTLVAGKNKKKAVIAPEVPKEPLLHVVLHDTVIFPEGGGQPTDTGKIKTIVDGLTWEVLQAKRHGGHAVHYVKLRSGIDIDAALTAFQSGSKVTVFLDQEDWDRRYDHMSMHTSQHLLSALLETRLNLPTLSWSLTSSPNPCYVEIHRGMTQEEITLIQSEANRLVFEGRKVHVEAEELDSEKEQVTEGLKPADVRAVGKALPQDYTGGVKRIVVIDGVDRNPCCGTHLPTIHNLQLFLLPHTEALSRSTTTSARLYFLSGPRLIKYLTSTHALLTHTASILSCGPPLVPERVNQVVEERRKAEKRVGDIEQELAEQLAHNIVQQIQDDGQGTFLKRHIHRNDDTTNALGFLSAIASSISAAVLRGAARPYIIVLSSSPSTQTANSVSTVLILGSDESKVKAAGEGLKARLGVKGGGKGPRWSGKFIGIWKTKREDATVEDVLGSV